MNVHNRWCFVLHNAALEGRKHQGKLVHAERNPSENPKTSSSSDATDGSYNVLNFGDMYSCFQLFPLCVFVVVRGHAKEAAASTRSCDFAGSDAGFPTLERKWEEGGSASRQQSAPSSNSFHPTGLGNLVPDHLSLFYCK